MQTTVKSRMKKIIKWMAFVFAILFILRFAYGYTKTIDNNNNQTQFFDNLLSVKRNYASKEYKTKSSPSGQPSNAKMDQKYEKVAEIKTKSSEFLNEEKKARAEIEKYNALVQFEQKSGNDGNRKLNLLIGVPPENFDSLYHELITIGKVQAKQITKKDKTNEYKELNAKKLSLEKIRASLIDLKDKGGKIEEYMDLENRILEIEQELQNLGVSLGDFDDENEFCTVQFSLIEGKIAKIGISQRIKVAFDWTVRTYLYLISTAFFVILCSYLLVLVVDRGKILQRIMNSKE